MWNWKLCAMNMQHSYPKLAHISRPDCMSNVCSSSSWYLTSSSLDLSFPSPMHSFISIAVNELCILIIFHTPHPTFFYVSSFSACPGPLKLKVVYCSVPSTFLNSPWLMYVRLQFLLLLISYSLAFSFSPWMHGFNKCFKSYAILKFHFFLSLL